MPTLLVVLYVVLNTYKASGTWSHTINDAYNIDMELVFIEILIAIGLLLQ